jgi:hypothetical protein
MNFNVWFIPVFTSIVLSLTLVLAIGVWWRGWKGWGLFTWLMWLPGFASILGMVVIAKTIFVYFGWYLRVSWGPLVDITAMISLLVLITFLAYMFFHPRSRACRCGLCGGTGYIPVDL